MPGPESLPIPGPESLPEPEMGRTSPKFYDEDFDRDGIQESSPFKYPKNQ